jgi:hypothetical protein
LQSIEIGALDSSQVEILDIKSPAQRTKTKENWTTNRFLRRLYEA